ncbi:MAG: TolC family protein [Polyangiaceae bacterium]
MRKPSVVSALVLASLLCASAHAQQPPAKPKPGQPPAPATPPTPAYQPPITPATPPKIEVSDPLLTPVPAARRTLVGWRDTVSIINSRNTDLQIAVQEVVRSRGLARQALGRVLPTLDAQGTAQYGLVKDTFQTLDTTVTPPRVVERRFPDPNPSLGADLTLAVPLSPRLWHGVGTARHTVTTSMLRVEDQRRLVLATVADNIVSVVTAERVSEIRRVGLRSSLERYELMSRRLRLESGTKLDVVRAEQDVTLARNEVVTANESLLTAREALGLALGMQEPYGVPQNFSLAELEQSARNACTVGSPDNRSDVLAARSELDIAERGVRDAQLGYSPTAQLSSTASIANRELVGNKQYDWNIRAVLNIPIFDGGVRYGETRTARASVEQSKSRLDVTKRGANVEASQSARKVEVAEQARVLSERSRDLAKETARLSQVAFDAGSSTSFELVESAQQLREAELNLALREFEVVRAKITALLARSNCAF